MFLTSQFHSLAPAESAARVYLRCSWVLFRDIGAGCASGVRVGERLLGGLGWKTPSGVRGGAPRCWGCGWGSSWAARFGRGRGLVRVEWLPPGELPEHPRAMQGGNHASASRSLNRLCFRRSTRIRLEPLAPRAGLWLALARKPSMKVRHYSRLRGAPSSRPCLVGSFLFGGRRDLGGAGIEDLQRFERHQVVVAGDDSRANICAGIYATCGGPLGFWNQRAIFYRRRIVQRWRALVEAAGHGSLSAAAGEERTRVRERHAWFPDLYGARPKSSSDTAISLICKHFRDLVQSAPAATFGSKWG